MAVALSRPFDAEDHAHVVPTLPPRRPGGHKAVSSKYLAQGKVRSLSVVLFLCAFASLRELLPRVPNIVCRVVWQQSFPLAEIARQDRKNQSYSRYCLPNLRGPWTAATSFLAGEYCHDYLVESPLFGGRDRRPGGSTLAAEPVVQEVRENGISVIHIKPANGTEKTYRIDLSQRHGPASEKTELIRQWESCRLGAFVCFNSNQFTGEEFCKLRDPKV